MYSRTKAADILVLSLGLAVGATSAAEVQKYGATFETAAGGVSNDFAYAVGDYIGGNYYNPDNNSYHGVADGEPYGWFAGGEDDESDIIARTDAAGGQALRLNTDVWTLTNKLQKGVADEITATIANGGCAYIEADVKFVPNDSLDIWILGGIGGYRHAKSVLKLKDIGGFEPFWPPLFFVPASSTSPLFAIYAFKDENEGYYHGNYYYHSTTNLVVYHGVMDANGGVTFTNEVFTSVNIDGTRYTKLRVEMKRLVDSKNPKVKYNVFSVKVDDGEALSSVTALDALFGGTATGTWFMTIEDRSVKASRRVSSLNFKGCGEIDNIKVGVMGGGSPLPYDPNGHIVTDEDVLDWIARYSARQSDINALSMDKFREEFLLNLDLTKECGAELKVSSIQIEDVTVTLGVRLTRTEDGVPVGGREINGRLKLLGGANLADGAFTELVTATIGDDDFGSGDATGVEYELPQQNRPVFFKAVIVDPE